MCYDLLKYISVINITVSNQLDANESVAFLKKKFLFHDMKRKLYLEK